MTKFTETNEMKDTSCCYKHLFEIFDYNTGKRTYAMAERVSDNLVFKEDGTFFGRVVKYHFKARNNNEIGVKEIERLGDYNFRIISMFKNKQLPEKYSISISNFDYFEEFTAAKEKSNKEHLMWDIHNCLGNLEFKYFPKPIKLELKSINKIVDMQYLTRDHFGNCDIINYHSDRIRTKELSSEELTKILRVL